MIEPSAVECPFCGARLPQRFQYCGSCGRKLSDPATTAEGARSAPPRTGPSPEGTTASKPVRAPERLQLTVMFADLVGSTALSFQLDPEEFRTVLRSYQAVSAEAIERHGGHVAQYLGDGILAYFGYPKAHEDEAQRAVLAGLDLLQRMRVLHGRLQERFGVDLAVRIAVHTGLVVVGEVGGGRHREPLALGGAPNVAARLQGLAGPNQLIASETSLRLFANRFESEDLGVHELKGVDRPIHAHRILGLAAPTMGHTRDDTPFVGRAGERRRLQAAWTAATAGRGRAIYICGEPGIGKSRLVGSLVQSIPSSDRSLMVWQCLASYEATPLNPVVQALDNVLESEGDSGASADDERRARLQAFLARIDLVDAMLPLAGLLSIPVEGLDDLTDTPHELREKTESAVMAVVQRLSREKPLLLVVEDLHWADPSTVELVWRIVDEVSDWRALLVLTSRPTFVPPWATLDRRRIDLHRLEHPEIEAMLDSLVEGRELPKEVTQLIISKTGGIPLFVEELLRTLVESHTLVEAEGALRPVGPLPSLVVPQSLQDSLEARLDLLGVGKEVAQVASVLGEAFELGLLKAVWHADEPSLQEGLELLTSAHLIAHHGGGAQSRYAFEHALVHDVAYGSLLKETRAEIHIRAARTLETRISESTRSNPELIAHHLEEAGEPGRAIPYLIDAAERAMRRSANLEAITLLRRGLDAAKRLPPSEQRDSAELDLLVMLGTASIQTQGYSSPESERSFRRARELSRVVGSGPALFGALFGLFTYYFVREEPDEALALAQELHKLAGDLDDPGLRQAAHTSMAAILLARGRPGDAQTHARAALALYDQERDAAMARHFGQDFGVTANFYLSWSLWACGRPESARREAERALARAREIDHPHTLALALSFADTLALLRGEPERALAMSDECIRFSEDRGFPHWAADARVIHGCALVALGREAAGVECMRRGRDAYRAMGAELQLTFLAPLRIHALLVAGEHAEAEEELSLNLERAESGSRDWWWLGELYRLRAEWGIATGAPSDGLEADLYRAVHECRRTGSKSFGVKAVTSLARLLAERGAREEARTLLKECLEGVEEGLSSPVVEAALELAESLG